MLYVIEADLPGGYGNGQLPTMYMQGPPGVTEEAMAHILKEALVPLDPVLTVLEKPPHWDDIPHTLFNLIRVGFAKYGFSELKPTHVVIAVAEEADTNRVSTDIGTLIARDSYDRDKPQAVQQLCLRNYWDVKAETPTK